MSAFLRILCGGVQMSALGYLGDDLFTFRIIKSLSTNPSNEWVNSYEFRAVEDGLSSTLIALASVVVAFEAALHATSVVFKRAIISTWEPDSVPYDPLSFISVPLSQNGTRPITSEEVEPTGMAWRVLRQASTGRFGNLFYRGALFENEVLAPAGIPVLENTGDADTLISDALTSSTLEDFMGSTSSSDLEMVMISANGTQIRKVITLISGGVSLIKQDHMWFNRVGPS
jgi:hypothetical protein